MLHYLILNQFCFKIHGHLFNIVLDFHGVLFLENKCLLLAQNAYRSSRKYEIIIFQKQSQQKNHKEFSLIVNKKQKDHEDGELVSFIFRISQSICPFLFFKMNDGRESGVREFIQLLVHCSRVVTI